MSGFEQFMAALMLVLIMSCTGPGSSEVPKDTEKEDGTEEATSEETDSAADPSDWEPPPIYTPRWAFEPWISKDISDTDDSYAFVQGFRERDIPVGVLVIDSPWATNYNTFVPNPERYHDFGQLVDDLHSDDILIVLWTTQMVNTLSFDAEPGGDTYPETSELFDKGLENGYYVNEGATWFWWKGVGAGVDFLNPDAMVWWHSLQVPLLAQGINGWKLDFGESYIRTPEVETAAGTVPHQEYSEAYYRDFYTFGAHTRGLDEFVTLVRPWDESYDFEGRFFARPEHAPVCWVGDQRRDWFGLSDALDHLFRSAAAGYVTIGSDIGGYLDRDDTDLLVEIPWDTEVFARWTAVGALSPLMLLHGRANITPWAVPDHQAEVVTLYRYWATLHHQLVPFFDSLAHQAYAGGEPPVRPVGDEEDWPGDFRYMLGDAFLVAPVLDAGGARDVALPAGPRWYDWWDEDATPLDGGQTLPGVDITSWSRVPLYVREGAVIPIQDATEVTGLGTAASRTANTVLAYPGAAQSEFTIHEADDSTWQVTVTPGPSSLTLTLTRNPAPVYLRLCRHDGIHTARVAGEPLAEFPNRAALDDVESGFAQANGEPWLWIKLPASTTPLELSME